MCIFRPEVKKPAIVAIALYAVCCTSAAAGTVFQPPGPNLTYGDVSRGALAQPTSGNPAAPAAAQSHREQGPAGGTTVSAAAGLEYGNVQELFDFIDELSRAFGSSPPGTGGGPGQGPDPDRGIDIGKIIDEIDPDLRPALEAIGREVAIQASLLGLMATEGYGKAWIAADIPITWNRQFLGGTWTTNIGWSGASKALGVAAPIEFDLDEAAVELERWVTETLGELTGILPLSGDVLLEANPATGNIIVLLDNDSSMLTKAFQLTDIAVGYSRRSLATGRGDLYLGLEASFYLMRLSRFSARLGDITDSEDLFKAIDNSAFRNEEDVGVHLGALWVSENYQLGAQWSNINEPEFSYPDVDVSPYRDQRIVEFLLRDQRYRMDSQLKLEASAFTSDRRWSAYLGLDADSARDPFGDEFQWVTLSGSLQRDSFWLPNLRLGYRKNLAGTELGYLSAGLTAFRYLNFDISSALETVSISGDKLPRGLMVSLGFDIAW